MGTWVQGGAPVRQIAQLANITPLLIGGLEHVFFPSSWDDDPI